ncbi:YkvA family protein [Longibaculum muris]|uniref:YkvA family protein n=1 Tax=Longibaculum muris TaxID=1796628 RepID=UPI0022E91FA9|nr:YkvA family protein [Longibaculum muris]
MNIKEKAQHLKQNITALTIAMKKKETPIYAKVIVGITIGYALSPIDLIPDFIPILGYIDDMIILPLLIWLSIQLIPLDIMEESKKEAKNLWENGYPKKWYYGIPIVFIWIFIIFMIIKQFI